MDNGSNPLQQLTEAVERLCLENEILGLMMQDYWTEKRSWQGALYESASDAALRSPVQAVFAEVASASLDAVPPACLSIFESLTKAIVQTRDQSAKRIEKLKEPL